MTIGTCLLAALLILVLPALGTASLPLPSRPALFSGQFPGAAPVPPSEADDDPESPAPVPALAPGHGGASGGSAFGVLSFRKEGFHQEEGSSPITEHLRGTGLDGGNGRIELEAALPDVYVDLSGGFAAPGADAGSQTKSSAPDRTTLSGADDDTLFAYRLGAGLEVTLRYGLSRDLDRRYVCPEGGPPYGASFPATEPRRESHEASVGIRIRF